VNVIGRARRIACVFRTSLRSGVWSVTRDAVFYGDYLSRTDALVGACSAARAVESLGGSAEVRMDPGDIIVRHQDRYPSRIARP
jgi:hypothetical protein